MALSKEHQKLALQIAHDAAHAAGIQAADAATHQGLNNEDALPRRTPGRGFTKSE